MRIKEIHSSFNEVDQGEIVVYMGSSGTLEIAVNQGNAMNVLNLRENERLVIDLKH